MVPFAGGNTYEFFGVERKVAYICYKVEKDNTIRACKYKKWGDTEINCNGLEKSDDTGPTPVPQQTTKRPNVVETEAPKLQTEKAVATEPKGDLQLWLMQLWLIESMSHRCIQLWLIDAMSHRCLHLWLIEM
eukprot:sb/3474969/